jgi:hypothetical protein
MSPGSRAADRWMLESGQEYFAVGVGTGATGKGGHLIIIDDPLKDREEADSETRRQTSGTGTTTSSTPALSGALASSSF